MPEDLILDNNQDGEPQAPARPDWLPERFKAPEDLARAWDEEQRKITEQGQQIADLKSELEGMAELVAQTQSQFDQQPQYQQPYQPQQQYDDPLVHARNMALEQGDWERAYAYDDQIKAKFAIAAAQQYAPQPPAQPAQPDGPIDVLAVLAEQALERQYGEAFTDLRAETAQLIESGRVPITEHTLNGVQTAMDTAFRLAHHDALYAQQTQAQQAEKARAQAREEKLAAQGIQGGGTRPPAADAQQKVMEELRASMAGRFSTF